MMAERERERERERESERERERERERKGGKHCRKRQGFNRRWLPSTGFWVVGPGIFCCTTWGPLSQQRD